MLGFQRQYVPKFIRWCCRLVLVCNGCADGIVFVFWLQKKGGADSNEFVEKSGRNVRYVVLQCFKLHLIGNVFVENSSCIYDAI